MDDIHGGNIKKLSEVLELNKIPQIKYDFSVNLNLLGPPPKLSALMNEKCFDWNNYPDPSCIKPVKCLADAHNISQELVTIGNGATEIFSIILTAFDIKSADYYSPCYSGYREVCEKTRVKCFSVKKLNDLKSDAVFIGYPNNPTGHLINKKNLLDLVYSNEKKLFIIDESFIDFVFDSEKKTFIGLSIPENLIVVKSLTKMFNIAGLRLGMAVSIKDNIDKINKFRLPWSVNAIAQEAATVLYSDKGYINSTKTENKKSREKLFTDLSALKGFEVFPSETNFILFKSDNLELQKRLLEKGIFIRSCRNIDGLGQGYYRIAVKNREANDILVNAIKSIK